MMTCRSDVKIVIPLAPVTKKNSQRLIMTGGKPRVLPSKAYSDYEENAGWYIKCKHVGIDYPVNVRCIYYMKTKRKVDLVNLEEATLDVLVKYGVLKDDNAGIVVSMNGSRVLYDKDNPRVEIYIQETNQ